MSQENVEIVRRAFDAFRRGDLDDVLALCDRDVVLDLTHNHDWPEGTYVGHAGVRRFLTELLELWEDFEVGVDEHISAPDGRIVSLWWQRGRGRHSGLTINMELAHITTVRNGKHLRIDSYDDCDQALKAAGLEE
jgi:ketosteroid isomerase-like protein